MKKLALIFILFFSVMSYCQQETDSIVPPEILFKKDVYENFTISPNGKLFACIWKKNAANHLLIIDIDNYEVKHTFQLRFTAVNNLYWLTNDRILYESLGNINAVNIDGTNASIIISRMGDGYGRKFEGFLYNSVVDFLPKNKNEILIESFDSKGFSSLKRVNIFTGNKIRVTNGKNDKINKWIVNGNSEAKIGVRFEDDGFNYLTYNENTQKWEQLYLNIEDKSIPFMVKANSFLDQNVNFEGFGYDNDKFFISSNVKSDKRKLIEYDLKRGEVTDVILENKNCDISDPHGLGSFLIFGGQQKKLVGVRYEGLLPTYKWFSDDFKAVHDSISKKHPQFFNDIIDYDSARNRFVIYQWSDVKKGNIGVFDVQKQTYDVVFHFNKELNKYKLSKTRSFAAKTRDNYSIPCYINLPKNYKKDGKTPLIVFPHGGPWARDYWEFNQEVQYFSSRGFAVLRINFRGSTGFGKKHVLAGINNLDKIMINDIADATKFTLDNFDLNENNTNIYGHSYGGYATYLSLAKYPELFKSGVAISAPSDIKAILKLLQKNKDYFSFEFWTKVLGTKKKKYLNSISPINFASNIKNPILIFHGRRDKVIPVDQSEKMAEKLKKTNNNVSHEILNREGHGIKDSNTLTYVLEKVVGFFNE